MRVDVAPAPDIVAKIEEAIAALGCTHGKCVIELHVADGGKLLNTRLHLGPIGNDALAAVAARLTRPG